MDINKRFWSKVSVLEINDCWQWKNSVDKWGYGKFSINKKTVSSHRVAWALTNGEIPEGKQVLHKCDNPPCCNPNHLFIGTNKENSDDMMKKGRRPSSKGDNNGNAKLTSKQVEDLRSLYHTEGYLQRELSEMYEISQDRVSKIVNRKAWT